MADVGYGRGCSHPRIQPAVSCPRSQGPVAVTLAYRTKLDGDLRSRLQAAGSAVQKAGTGSAAKPLVQGLALDGIATSIRDARQPLRAGKGGPAVAPIKTGSSIQSVGSGFLLALDEVLPDGTRVRFSASRASVNHAVASLLDVELLVAVVALALAAVLVLRTTRTALRPLLRVSDTASRIAGGDSTLRLRPSRADTELGSMAAAFDRMVDALEAAVEDARASEAATRRFLADASHELRTPIAALQASIETLLRNQPERPDRDMLEAALARDATRLGRLVDDLLGLARLEASPAREPVALDPQARGRETRIGLSVHGDTTVLGDTTALTRILRNLLDNALAAVRGDGEVGVNLARPMITWKCASSTTARST